MPVHKPVIIFDMDGVLFDSEPLHCQFETSLFQKYGIKPTHEQKKLFVGLGDTKFWTLLKEMFSIDEPLDKLIEFDRRERISFFRHNVTPPMEGAGILLRNLYDSGFRIALASSSLPEIIDHNLSMAGFDHFFSAKICNDMIKNGKPEPDIFLHAAKIVNESPENCVVIEDSEHGVKAARAAGMKCIALKNDSLSVQDVSGADLIITDLNTLTVETILGLFP